MAMTTGINKFGVVGDEGVFYKTINGGQSWESQNSDNPTTADFAFLNFSDRNNFYIGGNNGTLSKVKDEKDTYSVKFWYDQLGRIIAKQDARQYAFDGFSYTVYDEYNRIVEAGEVLNTTESITKYAKANISSQVPYKDYLVWLAKGTKRQVSETKYDFQVKDFADYDNFEQENLRPRVATTLYREEIYADGHYDFASHYSYDEHGNVQTLITENTHLAHLNEQYKRIDYDYDLISGNVLQVAYQEGDADQFFHKYTYDEDNRLVDVFTSTNGAVWDKDCENQYYRHGALKRMEIGQEKVQALDYAYTIHGWLKAVNSETAESNRDIGQDGIANGFAKDEMGFSLKYYNGDYKAINSPTQGATLNDQSLYTQLQNSANLSSGEAKNLYNGNIMAMTTSINKFGASGTQTMAYNYDQLNRITDAQAYYYTQSQPTSVGTWTATDDYKTSYGYDANGNLKTLTRNGVQKTGQQRAMDNFEYHYEDLDESQLQGNNKFKRETNRLSYVTDDVTASNYDDDIDGHQIDNYSYDGIGNLTKDVDEQIEEIVWHVNGKVKEVKRTAGSEKSDLEFFYDAMGNRTIKLEKPRNTSGLQSEDNWVYTYYSRDAQGNVMGIYKRTYEAKPAGIYEEKLKLEEQSIFGSSRAGLYRPDLTVATRNFTATFNAVDKTLINQTEISVDNTPRYTNLTSHYLGKKSYELSNHLGNVLVVVSDRVDAQNSGTQVTGYKAVVVSANDYYPFGSPMPERSFSSPSYRYGFNGMEKDDEVKGSGNHYDLGFRHYDPRLARMMSVDPRTPDYPWQSPYAYHMNSPVWQIDYMGAGGEPESDDDLADGDFTTTNNDGTTTTDTYREGTLTHIDGVEQKAGEYGEDVTVGNLKGLGWSYDGKGTYGMIDRATRSVTEIIDFAKDLADLKVDKSKTTMTAKINGPIDYGFLSYSDEGTTGLTAYGPKITVMEPSLIYDFETGLSTYNEYYMGKDGVYKGGLVGGKVETGKADFGGGVDWMYKEGQGVSFKGNVNGGVPFTKAKLTMINTNTYTFDFGVQEDWAASTAPIPHTLFTSLGVKLNIEATVHIEFTIGK